MTVWRKRAGTFIPELINLLQTFATQSALAIQYGRLFREIEEKSRQIEAANRHKSEFLANMSRELRTLLNAIIGSLKSWGERLFGELNEKQAEYKEDILSSGRHLLSLINEILDLSKYSWAVMELELATFDLPLAIDNARTFVRERATKHGITLDVGVDDALASFSASLRINCIFVIFTSADQPAPGTPRYTEMEFRPMAAIIYGKIRSGLSPPYYDDILGRWGFPYASVSWDSHYNQLTDLGKKPSKQKKKRYPSTSTSLKRSMERIPAEKKPATTAAAKKGKTVS